MSIRETLIAAVNAGMTLQHSFKVAHKEWFGEIKLYYYRPNIDFGGGYTVSCGCLEHFGEDVEAAVDFFGTLAFNQRNLSHFISYLHDLELKGDPLEDHNFRKSGKFRVEDIEYMAEKDLEAMNQEFLDNHFSKYSPHASEFSNEKAIKMMELLRKEHHEMQEEDEDE